MIPTKVITLPGGATCKVRPFIARDWLRRGSIPELKVQAADATPTPPDPKFILELQTIALTACCGALVSKDGRKMRIVDKPFDEVTRPDEISIDLVDPADAEAIAAAVYELSGFSTGAAEKAEPFPPEQAGAGGAGRGGASVSDAPVTAA